MNGKSVK